MKAINGETKAQDFEKAARELTRMPNSKNRSYKVISRGCEKAESELNSESKGSNQVNDHLRKYWE